MSAAKQVRRRTPQEKKQLSLERDRRNSYGENAKASRKNIPRAKARARRANRHAATSALSRRVGTPDEQLDAAVEDTVAGRREEIWSKQPDQPLGEYLAKRRQRRQPENTIAPDTSQ